jgi:hypothetical protein
MNCYIQELAKAYLHKYSLINNLESKDLVYSFLLASKMEKIVRKISLKRL